MKFALIGYGKMGKVIEDVILSANANKLVKDEIVLKIGADNLQDLTIENLQKADVAIEFTQPDAAIANIQLCFDAGIPVVVGTTAWLDQLPSVKATCAEKDGALFYAPNFSIGVNIFFHLNKILAGLMKKFPEYGVEMEEIHHIEKKDAPSGTAITLAEGLMSQNSAFTKWVNEPTDDENIIEIVSKRIENVAGTHTVSYNSPIDAIEIKHTAHSREGFAQGAVMAAEWTAKNRGVFGMNDLLKF